MNPATATHFSNTFMLTLSPHISDENLVTLLNSSCTDILDRVAPLKPKRPKANTIGSPWLNDLTRAHRRDCRRVERRWKRDKFQVSYEIFPDCLQLYQSSVKTAKAQYFAELINKNAHRPKILFNTINSILNPAAAALASLAPTTETCEMFLNFFIEKIENIRSHISSSVSDPSMARCPISHLQQFQPVSSTQLSEVVSHMKPTHCPSDLIPPAFLRRSSPQSAPSFWP